MEDILSKAYELLPMILTGVLGFIALKLKRVFKVIKEVGELLVKISQAVADSEISKSELEQIKKEAKDIYDAIKGK